MPRFPGLGKKGKKEKKPKKEKKSKKGKKKVALPPPPKPAAEADGAAAAPAPGSEYGKAEGFLGRGPALAFPGSSSDEDAGALGGRWMVNGR